MLNKKFFIGLLLWLVIVTFLSLAQLDVSEVPKFPMIDKMVHFIFHFVLANLLFLTLYKEWGVVDIKLLVVVIFVFSMTYGGGIEWMQEKFTLTRHADWNDVLANTLGCGAGVLTMHFFKLYAKPF